MRPIEVLVWDVFSVPIRGEMVGMVPFEKVRELDQHYREIIKGLLAQVQESAEDHTL